MAGEADMPLEQLLAMYGMVVDEDNAPEAHSAADVTTKEPLGSGRSRKRRRVDSGDASALCIKVLVLRMGTPSCKHSSIVLGPPAIDWH